MMMLDEEKLRKMDLLVAERGIPLNGVMNQPSIINYIAVHDIVQSIGYPLLSKIIKTFKLLNYFLVRVNRRRIDVSWRPNQKR